MSIGHSSPEQSFARKKKRYYDSEDDHCFDASRSNKKRRLQESLERENLLKAKTPSRAVTHWANPLQERENDRFSLRKPVIKNDPSKARDYDTSTASLASNCRIRTELLQDTNCSDKSKSLSLPRNQISRQVLKTGNTDNTGSEGVQRDNGVGGDHTDCTASRAITKDDRFENKALSDHIGDIKSQCSQNNGCQNFELLSENKDEASIIHVPPLYDSITTINSINQQLDEEVPCHSIFGSPSQMRHSRRAVAITQQNGHLSLPTIEKRSRVSKAPRSLLRKVLSRPRASIPLDKFRYLEDEIEFIDMIGETTEEQHHARIFRIAAGGRNYVLKVHKYKEEDISKSHPQFPLPNRRFDCESTSYARTAYLQDLPSSPIPKCYGYVDFTKIPQARSRHQRDPFRSTRYASAAYLDFLIQTEDRIGIESQQWRRYFRDKPPSACILRGIVLQDVPSCSLVGRNLSFHPDLMRSGRESLARLHKCGVLHGDVGDLSHALVSNSDGRIVWVGFGMSNPCEQGSLLGFKKSAAIELRLWESLFPKQRPRFRK